MKILFAFNRDLNPYVDVMMGALQAAGCPVDSGTDKFWKTGLFAHDIVHIQWPETLFDWRVPSWIEMGFLRRRLKEIRSRARIVYTRHNEVSHHANESNADILKELYDLIESECDAMVHLGEASSRACAERPEFADKRHAMIAIPVYDEMYRLHLGISAEEARKRLKLPRNGKIVLAFGQVRYESEKRLMVDAFTPEARAQACLLVPKWHNARAYSLSLRHPMLAFRTARQAAWAWRRGMKLGAKKFITDEEVALHFAAADVVFIQRLDDLNSGNVPMAFLFRKTVVGPDCGNIGHWLRATGNPVFDAKDPAGAGNALLRGLDLSVRGQGDSNYRYAMDHWTAQQAGEAHVRLYRELTLGPATADLDGRSG
jgi:hypothetical protein